MKNNRYLYILLITVLLVGACAQEPIIPETVVIEPTVETGTKGDADFTKFIAIGNSFVAGVQGGALFTEGQNNSLPSIMAKQFQISGIGGGAFVQPSINATLGWNLFITQPFLTDPTKPVLGRMLLQGTPPRPTPQAYAAGNREAVPNPAANPAFIYTGGKATLNNFGVPAIVLGQALIPQTGSWGAGAGGDPRFNPFYGRLAAPPGGTTTIIGDAAAAGGTFFLFWLGLDDFFLYAAFGGDPARAPLTPGSGAGAGGFDLQYGAAIGALLNSNANLKGVVGNFPDIFLMPHFTSVVYNPIPLDAATAGVLNGAFAGYNAALDGLIANATAFGISDALKAQIGTRKVTYAAGANKALINDETLTDLGPYFDGLLGAGAINANQRAALAPYQRVRQTTASDKLPLGAGTILGTLVGGNPSFINGLTIPLADQYVLIPSEIDAINAARTSYNTTIKAIADANPRLAFADINAALNGLIAARAGVYNGVTITPNINPPTGIYSEDGAHPNSRGYAFLSRVFIQAINDKFKSTVPLTNLSKYKATGLPIP
jgi:hypothetical protein